MKSGSQVSMIGIRGEGGIGKSTLTATIFTNPLEFAAKFWANVQSAPSITVLVRRALEEFGVPHNRVQAIEEKDLIPSLLRLLQQGRYLLAIDNLESVLTTAGEWQSGYDSFFEGFQNLGSESVLLLASREYPPKYFGWRRSRWLTLEKGLEPFEGAAMLKDLEVEDTDENRAKVSEQVQGNPLALTLIAGWLREEYRPGERQVNHLSQHTDLLQLEGKHRGEAQISVDRVLQWSINRLTPENQHLLTQISVLRGAFSAEVAAALVTETLKPSVSDADLDDLERRSLLQALPERNQQGQRLFRLQPRVQDFVQKRADDLTLAHERAAAYFWSHRKIEFAKEDTQAAVAEYEEAFHHQCQLKRYSEAAATVFACDSFLQRRSYYQILVDLYSQLHTDWQPTLEQRQDYAAVCNNLGGAYDSLGQYQQTIDFYRRSSEIQRQIGDRKGEANSLNNLGGAYYSLGQYQQAIEFLQQSLEIMRQISDRKGEASSLGNLGNAYYLLGQYQQAIEFLQQSLEIMRQISDRMGEALSLSGLGNAYGSFGQDQQAIAFHQQSLEINRQIGNRNGEAISLWNLGCLYQRRGRIRKGHKCKVAAVKTWQSLNLPADAILPPHISKHRFRHLEQQGKNWTESFIQAKEWLVWLKYVLFEAIFLIALLITLLLYLFQQFKASFVFWFVAGLVIVVIIWRLQQ
ncbi:MAG: tetratricopeptide repeat protein [Leptolyngbyaceae cyanobacterium SL_5_9]|nr:tetratricopeptide repeat protein [Leptolyngbyaceae cyanobacterium SL_5_9]